MKKLEEGSTTNHKVIAISIFLGFIGWLSKSVLDSLVLYQKPFLEVFIMDVPISEVYVRIFVCVCFFIFGLLLSKNLIQRKEAEVELKKAHDALSGANEVLEGKVEERTKEVEKLLREKTELIIQLGHDLKTPLTPLMGLLPTILRQESDPKMKEYLEISIRNVHFIRDLVSKTIDIARLDLELVEFNIKDTNLLVEIDKVIQNNQFLLKDKDIWVENNIDGKIFVKADGLKIREVFNNLLTNAVKYTSKKDGLITVNAKEDEGFVVISVKDTGVGMDGGQLEHVFDELYKVDPARHDLNSNGLGLSICKRIVEKHGGKIRVESKGLEEGSTVIFTLPLSTKKDQNK